MKYVNRTVCIIHSNSIILIENLLYPFFPVTKARLLCPTFCKLLALRSFRICLKSDDNFQEVQSHNIKPHWKTQRLPKRRDSFQNQTTICNSSTRRELGICWHFNFMDRRDSFDSVISYKDWSEYKCHYGQDNSIEQKKLIFKRRLKLLQESDDLCYCPF